jgi:hypothetical protein
VAETIINHVAVIKAVIHHVNRQAEIHRMQLKSFADAVRTQLNS